MKRRVSEPEYYSPKGGMNIFIFLAYLILGVYFINYGLLFYPIPEIISKFDRWIILAGGILMLFGAVHYFKSKRK